MLTKIGFDLEIEIPHAYLKRFEDEVLSRAEHMSTTYSKEEIQALMLEAK